MFVRPLLVRLIPFALAFLLGTTLVNVPVTEPKIVRFLQESPKGGSPSGDVFGPCRSLEAEILSMIGELRSEREELMSRLSKNDLTPALKKDIDRKLVRLDKKIATLEDYLHVYQRIQKIQQDEAIHDLLYRTHCYNF